MAKYKATSINYDTDGHDVDLPDSIIVDLPDDTHPDEVGDLISDAISDQTGYCHFGFSIIKM